MALSERDERLIREMEQQFGAEDPELARTLSARAPAPVLRLSPRRVGGGVALVLLGLLVVVAAVAAGSEVLSIVLGLAGFALAVGGVTLILSRPAVRARPEERAQGRGDASRPGFMARQEARWERRRDARP